MGGKGSNLNTINIQKYKHHRSPVTLKTMKTTQDLLNGCKGWNARGSFSERESKISKGD